MKEGDKFLAELKRLAEDRLKRELRDLKIWQLPKYDHYLDNVLDTTEN